MEYCLGLSIPIVPAVLFPCSSCGSPAGRAPTAHSAQLHATQQHGQSPAPELPAQAQEDSQEKHKCCQRGQDGQA